MKIITDNAVYVQKNDIAFMYSTDLTIPVDLREPLISSGIMFISDCNRYEFVKYDKPKTIDYLTNCDILVDYYEVKDMLYDELKDLIIDKIEERKSLIQKYMSLPLKERENNDDLVIAGEVLDFQISSLIDIMNFKKGKLKMNLPQGIDYPTISFSIPKGKGVNRISKYFKKVLKYNK